jgi:hypothetical protein
MLDLKQDSRVHDTPPPSVYSDLVPVSWQPEINSRSVPQDPHPVTPATPALAPGQRSNPGSSSTFGPRSTHPPSHLQGIIPDWQPTKEIMPSAGNRLSTSSTQPPVLPLTEQSSPPGKPLRLSAAPKAGVPLEESFALKATATPVSRPSGEKPLVHFPQDLPDTRSGQSTMEAGFYPVGYRPYLPASIVVVSGKHQEALSHYNRASYYGHANQLREAILEYQQAIRKNPELADAYVGLSSAYLLKHQWEEVFLNARKALSLKAGFMDPANIVQAKYNLSTAYCAADDYRQAKSFYDAIKLAHHPQATELWEYLKKNCSPKP